MVSFVYILIPGLSGVKWKVRAGLVWGLALIVLMCNLLPQSMTIACECQSLPGEIEQSDGMWNRCSLVSNVCLTRVMIMVRVHGH